MPLPRDLRDSLLCHNGEDIPGYVGYVLPGSPMFPAEEIVVARRMCLDDWEPDDPDQTEAPVWNELWVPFAGDMVSPHFVDAGPGIWRNHLGIAPHDDSAGFHGWPTLGTWLHHVAQAMERFDQPHYAHRITPPTLRGDGTVDWR